MRTIEEQSRHRAGGAWIMAQGWRDLLFMSWPVPPARIQSLLPRGLEADTFDGSAWVSIVLLRMTDLHLRWLPPIPGTSDFPEINLRTYVRHGSDAGVVFLSIDAPSWLGCFVARRFFHLPYFQAKMKFARTGDAFRMVSDRRASGSGPAAAFTGSYAPAGAASPPAAGTIEHFLLERFASYAAAPGGELYFGALQHSGWVVQEATAEVERNSLLTAAGLPPASDVLLRYSTGTDTRISPVRRIRAG